MSVHSSHCCVIHGCKYSDDDCPVVNHIEVQEYSCEMCESEMQKWNFVSDGNFPIIPAGKYGITVDVIEFDPVYSKFPEKNLEINTLSYGKIYDRYGKIFPEFQGSIYEQEGKTEAFMTLYIGNNGSSWGPSGDEIIAWRYRPKIKFVTSEIIDKTKKYN